MNLRLEVRPVSALLPYAQNTKQHTPDQIASICRSITRYGFNDPIGIRPDGTIVEGHGRLLAARELGMEQVPVLVLADLTDEQADKYRIAHNKISLTTGFKFDVLVGILREITGATDIKLADMGFSDEAAQRIFEMFPADGAPAGRAPRRAMAPLEYEIIFETKEQKSRFDGFLKAIRLESGHAATPGRALKDFIEETGVLQPVAGGNEGERHETA